MMTDSKFALVRKYVGCLSILAVIPWAIFMFIVFGEPSHREVSIIVATFCLVVPIVIFLKLSDDRL